MNELTQPEADDGFHEIQLSGKQLVALFMMGTTVLVMTFLCGVWVGRGVPNDRGVSGESTDAMASAAPPAAATPSQPAAAGGPPAAEPPAPAAEPDDELSYAKRLQAESTPTEKLKSSTAQTPPAKGAAAANQPSAAAAGTPAPPPAAKPPASTPQPKPDPAAPQMAARPGGWIVQVVSLQDRAAAATIARRLTAKGYPAFVADPAAGGPRIFRVQVGGYTDKNDAEQASRRLERDEQFKPFVRAR